MNLTALAIVGMTLGVSQPPADYYPIKSRTLKLDIDYKPDQRKNIQQVQLCVSRAEESVWRVVDAVTPDKDHFVFNASEDGLYWLNMVIVFRDGKKDPPDITRIPPAQKLLVDSTAPVVRITNAKRDGDEIVVEWTIDDKFPNEQATQVMFKAAGPAAIGDWQLVSPSSISKRMARFKPTVTGTVAIQVVAQDLAGNVGSIAQEVATGGVTQTVSSTPTRPTAPIEPTTPGTIIPVQGPLPPPSLSNILSNPTNPTPTSPSMPTVPPSSPTMPSAPTPIVPSSTSPPATVPNVESPMTSAQPPWSPPPANIPAPTNVPSSPAPFPMSADTGPQPIAVGAGYAPVPSAPAPATNAQFINFLRFDLQYQLENGPSGVSRIDLYVTRDEGRTWTMWSHHEGRESPIRVTLDNRYNQQPEGDYGFRLVPVSGAGLSDGSPTAGTAPEMRVHVDVTPPMIKVFAPTADANQRNTLVLHWEATDRNFGRDPILIEWSEQPTGPWKPVAENAAVAPVVGNQPVLTNNRVPNTGSYVWSLPATLATHKVYLKFTAWDAAGNRSEVITPSPILVDLTKPRAKIQAILPGGSGTR